MMPEKVDRPKGGDFLWMFIDYVTLVWGCLGMCVCTYVFSCFCVILSFQCVCVCFSVRWMCLFLVCVCVCVHLPFSNSHARNSDQPEYSQYSDSKAQWPYLASRKNIREGLSARRRNFKATAPECLLFSPQRRVDVYPLECKQNRKCIKVNARSFISRRAYSHAGICIYLMYYATMKDW